MDAMSDTSPRRLARIAGALYLVNIVLGAFAIGFVRSTLVVSGDAAATAHNIQAHELLYRAGWDADAARDLLQRFIIETFGDPEGIGVVDETGFLK